MAREVTTAMTTFGKGVRNRACMTIDPLTPTSITGLTPKPNPIEKVVTHTYRAHFLLPVLLSCSRLRLTL